MVYHEVQLEHECSQLCSCMGSGEGRWGGKCQHCGGSGAAFDRGTVSETVVIELTEAGDIDNIVPERCEACGQETYELAIEWLKENVWTS